MTDEQIIKAFEICYLDSEEECKNCPYLDEEGFCEDVPDSALLKDVSRLINRQKAEIERLNIRNKVLTEITKNYDWKFSKVKSEAIKEVIAEVYNSFVQYNKYDRLHIYEILDQIESVEERLANNLVKEMTEQRKEDEGK